MQDKIEQNNIKAMGMINKAHVNMDLKSKTTERENVELKAEIQEYRNREKTSVENHKGFLAINDQLKEDIEKLTAKYQNEVENFKAQETIFIKKNQSLVAEKELIKKEATQCTKLIEVLLNFFMEEKIMTSIEESKLDTHSITGVKDMLLNLVQGKPHLMNKFQSTLNKSMAGNSKPNYLKIDFGEIHKHWITCLACTHPGLDNEGFVFTVSNDKTMKQYNAAKSTLHKDYGEIHAGYIYQVKITFDNKFACTASHDLRLKLWNIKKELLEYDFGIQHSELIDALAISPDNKYIFTGANDKKLVQWDIEKRKLSHNWGVVHDKPVCSLCVTNDSRFIFVGSNKCLKYYNIFSRDLVKSIKDAHNGYIYNIRVDDTSNWIFTVSQDSHLKQWNLLEDMELTRDYGEVHTDWIRALAIDDNYLFTGGIDGSIKMYSIRDQKMLHDYGKVSNKGLAWIDVYERTFFVGGADKKLRQFEIAESKEKTWYAP